MEVTNVRSHLIFMVVENTHILFHYKGNRPIDECILKFTVAKIRCGYAITATCAHSPQV